MNTRQLQHLLEGVRDRDIPVDEALKSLRDLPFEDLGFAKVDHHRAVRHGMPEVVLGQGKEPWQVAEIAQALLAKSSNLLVTRANAEKAGRVKGKGPHPTPLPPSPAAPVV